MNCGWLMYRVPHGETFRYGCGFYQQSHGAECDHNYIDGPLATRFMLSCIQQRLASATLLPKMERRFRELAAKAKDSQEAETAIAKLRTELAELREELNTVSSNMSRAKTEAQYNAISADFEELRDRESRLAARIADEQSNLSHGRDAETEITAALGIVERLIEVMADSGRLDLAGQAFQMTNARLFLRFHPVQVKKRLLNKVAEGVVVFGAAPDPIEIYRGPTGRRALKQSCAASTELGNSSSCNPSVSIGSGVEGKSLGNVSRGERT